jgi:hypothetical protein
MSASPTFETEDGATKKKNKHEGARSPTRREQTMPPQLTHGGYSEDQGGAGDEDHWENPPGLLAHGRGQGGPPGPHGLAIPTRFPLTFACGDFAWKAPPPTAPLAERE